jgi:hypothetical protein
MLSAVFSAETRRMLAKLVVTPIPLDNPLVQNPAMTVNGSHKTL